MNTFPATSLSAMADHYYSDKGYNVMGGHGYTRVHERLFAGKRQASITMLEIGLLHPSSQALSSSPSRTFSKCPSLDMWADYLPNAHIIGLDVLDFSGYARHRVSIVQGDQGVRESMLHATRSFAGGGLDVIIDDGSHASHHQQISLGVLFSLLNPGGIYIIEDLHWQPPSLEMPQIMKTRQLLQVLQSGGNIDMLSSPLTQEERNLLMQEGRNIIFFDSLDRNSDAITSRDAMAVIFKRELLSTNEDSAT